MGQLWGGLSSNQCPDWDALKDAIDSGVLPSGGTAITGTTQSIYKTIGGATPLTSYVNINTSNAGYTSRSSNQSLWKSDFTTSATSSNTFTMYGTSSQGCINIHSQVKTDANTTKEASQLQVGDNVFTKANTSDEFDFYPITDISYSEKETVELATKSFTIEVSMTQPLFKDESWVVVKDLNVGDIIYTENGYEEILAINNLGIQKVLIYNIQIAHTFFANGIFCHNKTLYPLIGYANNATACANFATGTAFTFYYSGTFGSGTIIYSNANQGGFPSAYLWGTGTGNVYYNSTTGFTFTVSYNSITQTYTVGNYTSCNSFNLQVGASTAAACYSPITTVTATSDTGSYCTTNVFTSSAFASLTPSTAYYVSYLGQTLNIFYSGTPTNQATVYSGGCVSCPTSTTTTSTSTTTSSTTTTTTTSTTTAAPNATISLFAEAQATLTPNPSVRFYYQIGAGAWTLIGTVSVGTGGYSTITTSLSIPIGSKLSFAARNSTGANDVTFGTGTSTPPPSYSGNCGERLPYVATTNVTGNASYYLGIAVTGGAVVTC